MPFEIILKRYIREAQAEETRRIKVDANTVNIGTGAGNEIQLEGIGVSINHARIDKTAENNYEITDLGNADGTYVNNNLILKKVLLNDNDEIKIGKYSLAIKFPASPQDYTKIFVTLIQSEEELREETDVEKVENIQFVSRYKLSKSILNKTTLSLLGLLILIVLTVYWILDDDTEVFSPGKLSEAHTQFNNDCSKCHTVAWETTPDKACLECHKVNPHNENELFTPACVNCHFEHKGNPVLADLDNNVCTQCHSELFIKDFIPSSAYHRNITGFDSDHPEFAVLVKSLNPTSDSARVRLSVSRNLSDNTPIKLNHAVHLQPNLRGPDGPENLKCESCHLVDTNGEYMLPIVYEEHCARCHTLEFDPRFGDKAVPHEDTEIVREFLGKSYSEYAIANSGRLRTGGDLNTIRQWVSVRVKEAEDILYRKQKCAECHFFEEETISYEGLPKIIEPQIPERWFSHSNFDHELHAKNLDLSCDSCHDAEVSEETVDVLMPSIDNCRKCHSTEGGAKTECVFCHQYHERVKITELEGSKSIEEALE